MVTYAISPPPFSSLSTPLHHRQEKVRPYNQHHVRRPPLAASASETPYQQPFKTYLRHHPISATISKQNSLAGRTALIHRSTFLTVLP